ncbi:MAG TPA: YcaO-like family protein [Candidatus Paceibacterota bacterium]|nr:YcaO-like family protein [Candidatus Paceibacterota bacterium]
MERGYTHGDHQGFIQPAKDFFADTYTGPFRLPRNFSTLRDRFHIYIARRFFARSPFAASVLIENRYGLSLYWSMLISYLKKKEVLHGIRYRYRRDGYPAMHTFRAESPLIAAGSKLHSAAAHKNRTLALIKCIGELLERHFLAMPTDAERKNMVSASVDTLVKDGKDHANVFTYNRFLPIQKEHTPRLRFDTSKPIQWVRGRNISKNRAALLPTQTTFWLNGHSMQHKEGTVHEPTTSGCAGYTTKTGAVVRGLKEHIQRDGFMCYWLTQTSPNVIAGETIPDAMTQTLLEEFKKFKFDIYILDITTNIGLPTVTIVAIDRGTQRPRMHVTAASHVDPLAAISDGLYEMSSLIGCFDNGNETSLPEDFKPFLTSFGRLSRIQYLHGEEMLKKVEWFWQSKSITFSEFSRAFPSIEDDDRHALTHILELLKQLGEGYDAYIYEAQSPVLKTLRYHAVRTCVPKLMPLYLSENCATLDSDRLCEFAEWKGTTYNPHELLSGVIPPHPFP